MSFIQAQACGRLVRDPEVSYTQSGMAISKFTLAIDKPKRQGQTKAEANFYSCNAFGKLAELIGNGRFLKGDEILVRDCRPDINEWTDKNGQKHRDLVLIINAIDFIGSGKKRSNSAPSAFDNMGGSIGGDMEVDF